MIDGFLEKRNAEGSDPSGAPLILMQKQDNDNLELGAPPEENKPLWALPPEAEIRAAPPDVRAILFGETLERIAAAGETVDPGWLRAAVGVASDLHVKHVPRLLKEAPEYAAQVKAGRAKLPTAGNAWHFFWQCEAKKAVKMPPADPTPNSGKTSPIGEESANSDANSSKTSPIGEEKLELATFEPEPEPGEKERRRQRFEELKRVVHAGLDTFLEVGRALVEIRAEKFYRMAGFAVFDDFLRAEFDLSRTHGYRLMDAVASVEDLSSNPDVPPPTNLEQVRPLAGLSSEEKKEVWTEAVRTAPNGGPPTGAFVKKIREARGKTKPPGKAKNAAPPSNATPTSTNAAPPAPIETKESFSLDVRPSRAAERLEEILTEWRETYWEALLEKRASAELNAIGEDIEALVERVNEYAQLIGS